jgi:hypothetical protein
MAPARLAMCVSGLCLPAALRQGYDSTQVRIPMKIEDVVNGAVKVIDNQECRKLCRDVLYRLRQ